MKKDRDNVNNKDENHGEKKRIKFSYSLFTFVLIICIIQLTVSNINNISKNITFTSKIKHLEQKRDEELDKNKQLKSDIENFDSASTLESIARNNLKMAGQDEILVIINKPEENTEKENKISYKNFFKKKNKTAE